MRCGVYWIRNTLNGRFYIGSSNECERRWNAHRYYLRRNKHHNRKLQRSWNKNGEDVFEFAVLEEVEVKDLLNVEQWYLDNTTCLTKGYNLWPDANRTTRTEDMKRRQSIAMKKVYAEGRGAKNGPENFRKHAESIRIALRAYRNGVFVGDFRHAQEAADKLILTRSSVQKVLTGKRNSVFRYTFERI